MMKKSNLVLFFLLSQLGFSQITSRIVLHGQAVNDSIKIDNVLVFNVNSKFGMLVKNDGLFEIPAKIKDTLIFSSMQFLPKKVIITSEDFDNPLIVKLKIYTTYLKEVYVKTKKFNQISKDTQKYVDRQYVADEKTSPKNTNVYDGSIPNGIDFVRLFNGVVKLFKNKNPKKIDYFADTNFTELTMSKVKYSYFTNTLKLKDEEVRLFLFFCENDPQAQDLSRYKTSLELMDFLFKKSLEFDLIKNENK